ncbi:MAG: hypothetical protein ACI9R3_002704 [Verrucomicrobiales bacterium]
MAKSLFITLICLLAIALRAHGQSIEFNAQEKALFALINDDHEQGRKALLLDPRLSMAARSHALDMVTRGYYGHTSPEGVGPNERARRAGYPLPKWYHQHLDANNIESYFYGSGTWNSPESAFNWFLNSETVHKPHILAESSFVAEQTVVGVGYAENPRTGVGAYVFLSSHPFEFENMPPPVIILDPNPTGVKASATNLAPNELYNLQISRGVPSNWETVDAFVADSDAQPLQFELFPQETMLFFRLVSPLR